MKMLKKSKFQKKTKYVEISLKLQKFRYNIEPEKKEEENIRINEEIKEEIKDKENILIVKLFI